MTYNEILKHLSDKENVSVKEIENEMVTALRSAGLDCSAKEFIEKTVTLVKEKTIYSKLV